jgi:hypothetical protein
MTEIRCQCGLKAEVTVSPPQSGLPMNWTPTFLTMTRLAFAALPGNVLST